MAPSLASFLLVSLAVLMGSGVVTDAAQNLTIASAEVSYQIGHNASIKCVGASESLNPLRWTLPNGVVLPLFNTSAGYWNETVRFENDSRISYDGVGNIAIANLTLDDSGAYLCSSHDFAFNATQNLKVYIMPDYIVETIVLLSINGGLLIVFALCSVYTLVQNRRDPLLQSRQST